MFILEIIFIDVKESMQNCYPSRRDLRQLILDFLNEHQFYCIQKNGFKINAYKKSDNVVGNISVTIRAFNNGFIADFLAEHSLFSAIGAAPYYINSIIKILNLKDHIGFFDVKEQKIRYAVIMSFSKDIDLKDIATLMHATLEHSLCMVDKFFPVFCNVISDNSEFGSI